MDKKATANNNVVVELDKIRQYDNKGAHGTRGRYLDGCKRSFRIIDSKFKIQKVENLQGKHLQYLVDEMIRSGYSLATIRTELSALRTTYEKAGGKGRLLTNKQLGVPKGARGKEDRAWSSEEIAKAIDLADKMDRVDVLLALHGGAAYGFRINEVCTIRVEDVEKALITNQLKVTGKGGKVRAVPAKTEYQKLVIKLYMNMHATIICRRVIISLAKTNIVVSSCKRNLSKAGFIIIVKNLWAKIEQHMLRQARNPKQARFHFTDYATILLRI